MAPYPSSVELTQCHKYVLLSHYSLTNKVATLKVQSCCFDSKRECGIAPAGRMKERRLKALLQFYKLQPCAIKTHAYTLSHTPLPVFCCVTNLHIGFIRGYLICMYSKTETNRICCFCTMNISVWVEDPRVLAHCVRACVCCAKRMCH